MKNSMNIGVNTFLSSAPPPKSCRTADAGDKGSPTILPEEALT